MNPRDVWRSWGGIAVLVFAVLIVVAAVIMLALLDALGVLDYARALILGEK